MDLIKEYVRTRVLRNTLSCVWIRTQYLDVQIERTSAGGFIWHQKDKIAQLLKQFGMEQCKGAKTPTEVNKGDFEESGFVPRVGQIIRVSGDIPNPVPRPRGET